MVEAEGADALVAAGTGTRAAPLAALPPALKRSNVTSAVCALPIMFCSVAETVSVAAALRPSLELLLIALRAKMPSVAKCSGGARVSQVFR